MWKQLLDNSNTILHYQYLEGASCKILTVLLLRIQPSGMWCCVTGWVVPDMLKALCFFKTLRTTHLMTLHHMSDLNLLLIENTVFETVMLIVLILTYWTAGNISSLTFCYNRNFILFWVQYLSSKWAKLIYTYKQWIYWKDKKLSLHQFNDNPLTVLIQWRNTWDIGYK